MIRTPVDLRWRSSTSRAEISSGRIADPYPWSRWRGRGGLGVVSVDGLDDLAELGDGERVDLADRRDPEDPAQSPSYATDQEVGGRVGQSLLAVPIGDP